jgi:hypothetical protein
MFLALISVFNRGQSPRFHVYRPGWELGPELVALNPTGRLNPALEKRKSHAALIDDQPSLK